MKREIIDLSIFKKYEKLDAREASTKLQMMMEQMSAQINKEAGAEFGVVNLLNSDGTLDMAGYAGDKGYSAEQIEKDKEKVRELEIQFSHADDPRVLANYGNITPEERVKRWKSDKLKDKNGLMEMAVTGLLHKLLKDDFLVARASAFDDYTAGVDNVILNKRTGEVICAFDEVHEGGMGERTGEKEKKIKKKAMDGGARVRYGIKMEEGKLKRSEMYNVPVFYLGLATVELEDLLKSMNFNPDGDITDKEFEIFGKLTKSLREQKQMLDETKGVHFAVRRKLETFNNLLEEFENIKMAA